MSQQPLILGTAGHIDHGKTTLVKALTGVNTDRLPEERLKGISIEFGYAALDLEGFGRVSIVDVPGHREFIRNMVAGVTSIDLFLLVVDATEGPMPQTYEHLQILKLLGVSHGMVVLTKMDLTGERRREEVGIEIEELLKYTGFGGLETVEVSSLTGEGTDNLKLKLAELSMQIVDKQSLNGTARLHVDKSFTVKGSGTVVTGTLWGGSVRVGEKVWVLPKRQQAVVSSLQVHDKVYREVSAGQRIAMSLIGVTANELERGYVIVSEESEVAPTFVVDAEIEVLQGVKPITGGPGFQIHHGTRDCPARVTTKPGEVLRAGDTSTVRIRLDYPIIACVGDHLILRSALLKTTVAGGVITDVSPSPSNVVGEASSKTTETREKKMPTGRFELEGQPLLVEHLEDSRDILRLLEMDGFNPRSVTMISGILDLSPKKIQKILKTLVSKGKLVKVSSHIYYRPESLVQAQEIVEVACKEDGEITVKEMHKLTGARMQYAQTLLDYMVKKKVLAREDDLYRLKAKS